MLKFVSTAALAVMFAVGLTVGAHAMSHGKSEAREAFNAALDKCEDMQGDQREECENKAMEEYREAREKEKME